MPKNVPEKKMKIGEVAKAADVPAQTIEYYIMLGLVTPTTTTGSRRRFFDEQAVKRIRLIRDLNDSGYTLREIRTTWLRKR